MTAEQFKASMYDYANINEYYSYFGSIVYISSSYFKGEDYFLVLRTPKEVSVVVVTADEAATYAAKTNRNDVVKDLNELQANVSWVLLPGFVAYLNGLLANPAMPDKNDLIKIKNTDMSMWNNMLIDNMVKYYKVDHTVTSRNLAFSQSVRNNVITTFTSVEGIYGTLFSLQFDWVVGNSFFDVKIRYFSSVKTRRLQYFDLHELASLLKVFVKRDEKKSLDAIDKFTS